MCESFNWNNREKKTTFLHPHIYRTPTNSLNFFFSILSANFVEHTFKDVGFLLTKHREILSMSACTKWMRKEIAVMKAAFSDTHAQGVCASPTTEDIMSHVSAII